MLKEEVASKPLDESAPRVQHPTRAQRLVRFRRRKPLHLPAENHGIWSTFVSANSTIKSSDKARLVWHHVSSSLWDHRGLELVSGYDKPADQWVIALRKPSGQRIAMHRVPKGFSCWDASYFAASQQLLLSSSSSKGLFATPLADMKHERTIDKREVEKIHQLRNWRMDVLQVGPGLLWAITVDGDAWLIRLKDGHAIRSLNYVIGIGAFDGQQCVELTPDLEATWRPITGVLKSCAERVRAPRLDGYWMRTPLADAEGLVLSERPPEGNQSDRVTYFPRGTARKASRASWTWTSTRLPRGAAHALVMTKAHVVVVSCRMDRHTPDKWTTWLDRESGKVVAEAPWTGDDFRSSAGIAATGEIVSLTSRVRGHDVGSAPIKLEHAAVWED